VPRSALPLGVSKLHESSPSPLHRLMWWVLTRIGREGNTGYPGVSACVRHGRMG
jgi:hypothetical protein